MLQRIGIVTLIASISLIAGCSVEIKSKPTSDDKDTVAVEEKDTIKMERGVALLPDGRYVACALTSNYDTANIACEWDNATTEEQEFPHDVQNLTPATYTSPITGEEYFCIAVEVYDDSDIDCEFTTPQSNES